MNGMMMKVVIGLGLLGGSGCGAGGRSPKDKCDDLVDVACTRIVECIPGAAGMHDACIQEFEAMQSCADIKSVGPSYDECVSQLGSRSCESLFPGSGSGTPSVALPSACTGVLSTGLARDGTSTRKTDTPLSGLLRGLVETRDP